MEHLHRFLHTVPGANMPAGRSYPKVHRQRGQKGNAGGLGEEAEHEGGHLDEVSLVLGEATIQEDRALHANSVE